MNRIVGGVISLSLVLCLSGCGYIKPKPSDLQVANFGERPTRDEAASLVKTHMSKALFDPYSAVYECDEPRKAWGNSVGKLYYGYAVTCNINAKNRFGAFVGSQAHRFIISSGTVSEILGNLEYLE